MMGIQTNSFLVSVVITVLSGCASVPRQEARIETAQPTSRALATTTRPVTAGVYQETKSRK